MPEGTRKPYPSDLRDDQWSLLAPLIPPKIGRGDNRTTDLREVFNAILYLLRTGGKWANVWLSRKIAKSLKCKLFYRQIASQYTPWCRILLKARRGYLHFLRSC